MDKFNTYVIVGENKTKDYKNFLTFENSTGYPMFTDVLEYAQYYNSTQEAEESFKRNEKYIRNFCDYEYIYIAWVELVQVNEPLKNLIEERSRVEQIKKNALSKLTEEERQVLGL